MSCSFIFHSRHFRDLWLWPVLFWMLTQNGNFRVERTAIRVKAPGSTCNPVRRWRVVDPSWSQGEPEPRRGAAPACFSRVLSQGSGLPLRSLSKHLQASRSPGSLELGCWRLDYSSPDARTPATGIYLPQPGYQTPAVAAPQNRIQVVHRADCS